MALLLEIVVGWLVVSPVLGVALGVLMARAGRLADERELPGDLVPDGVPTDLVDDAVVDDVVAAAARRAPERLVTVVETADAIPAPSRPLDDVLHLRLAHPES